MSKTHHQPPFDKADPSKGRPSVPFKKIVLDADTKKILLELKGGSEEAFEAIFYKWSNRIYNLLNSLLRSSQDAEDITQDVFFKIWENREKIDADRNFNAFIYRIARNVAFQFMEKVKVREDYRIHTPFDEEDRITSDEVIVARETEEQIDRILSAMPESRRQIYLMSCRDELDIAAISEKMGMPREKIYKELHYAKKQIKDILLLILFVLNF